MHKIMTTDLCNHKIRVLTSEQLMENNRSRQMNADSLKQNLQFCLSKNVSITSQLSYSGS
jgi:hypothetical protein